MPLGNSITYDFRSNDTRPIPNKYGYRYPLYQKLINAGIKFDFIGSEHAGSNFLPAGYDDNAGFPGIHDHELANLLNTGIRNQPPDYNNIVITSGPYLNTYQPDVVLLHIGTNDNQLPDGTNPVDVENILDEIKEFEETHSKHVTVLLARIIDRVPNATYVTQLNNNVQSMAMERVTNPMNDAFPDKIKMVDIEDGAEIIYKIDQFGTIGNGIIGDMSDYLHPNDKGYAKMAQVWFDGIIDVLPKLNARVFLEGAYSGLSNMETNSNFFESIPIDQPFNQFPWYFEGTEYVEQIPTNVIDWVLVSLRSDETKASIKAQRAGFIKEDGTIVDLDGESPLAFVVEEGSYYVVVEHRNHLPIMSSAKVPITP